MNDYGFGYIPGFSKRRLRARLKVWRNRLLLVGSILLICLIPWQLVAMMTTHASCSIPDQTPTVVASLPAPASAPQRGAEELSLQATLDHLGFTVNVPTHYQGTALLNWNGYRTSTRDDSLDSGRLASAGTMQFRMLGQQAAFAGTTHFGLVGRSGERGAILEPSGAATSWFDTDAGPEATATVSDSTGFYIEETSNALHTGPLFSTASRNYDGRPHLLVLPARTGGHWVDDGDNTGHWEGGAGSHALLLCWEDWTDNDFQDMIVLLRDGQPNDR